MNVEQVLEVLDQMVLPASTADIYNRALRTGVAKGANIPRERADMSSFLARMRKKDLVFSLHDDAGVLLWDVKKIKQPVRATQEFTKAVQDQLKQLRTEPKFNDIIADLFEELGIAFEGAAKALRRLPWHALATNS